MAEAYIYSGTDRQRVWRGKRGISLEISLVWKAGRLCSPFSRGYATPFGDGNGGAA